MGGGVEELANFSGGRNLLEELANSRGNLPPPPTFPRVSATLFMSSNYNQIKFIWFRGTRKHGESIKFRLQR